MFYTTKQHLEQLFDNTIRSHSFHAETKDEALTWRQDLQKKLAELIGFNHMTVCTPNPQELERVACDGYTRVKLTIQTEPDITMPFYLLIPDSGKEPYRTIIACHGHCGGGKDAVAGVRSSQIVSDAITEFNYNYGEQLAKRGYLVFCPDARGFGERRESYIQGNADWEITGSSCSHLNCIAQPLGQSVTGMWIWDLMQLVNYALSRPDVSEVGCVGLSGGGLQSLWLAAMDDRIQCCAVSGYFYGYKSSLLTNLCCSCNYVPDLWNTVDIGDLGAMIAPRPFVIETGDKDSLNITMENVLTQVTTVKSAMALYGAKDKLFHDVFDGEHRWHGDMVYQMLDLYFQP